MGNRILHTLKQFAQRLHVVPLRDAAPKAPKRTWGVIGDTVAGASHQRKGLPNQDAISSFQPPMAALPVILAVSDGHGDKRSFRSDRGAQLAVAVAIETIQEYLVKLKAEGPTHAKIQRSLEDWLPTELVRRWRRAVLNDIREDPFSDKERQGLYKKQGNEQAGHYLAYGATLLAAAVDHSEIAGTGETFAIMLQIGDGDILVIDEDGRVDCPLPDDDRLFAEETTSISLQNAHKDFRAYYLPFGVNPPAMILASTDGYSNSFEDQTEFEKIGPDILEVMRIEGLDVVRESLQDWLVETTTAGSGDDITLGMIYNLSSINKKPAVAESAPISLDR